jgi:hypothetical protein
MVCWIRTANRSGFSILTPWRVSSFGAAFVKAASLGTRPQVSWFLPHSLSEVSWGGAIGRSFFSKPLPSSQ